MRVIRLALVALCAALAGCAPLLSGPAPVPLSGEDRASLARLLEMGDRLVYDQGAVTAALSSPLAPVRRYATLAVGRVGGAGARETLVQLLADADTSVAASAAFSLGLLGDTGAVTSLGSLLADEVAREAPTVAGEAAAALAKIGTGPGHDALLAFLRSAPLTGEAARLAISPALLSFWRLPAGAPLAAPARWTASPDPELRWRAAHALARRPSPGAVALLLELARDRDVRVRALALRGITGAVTDSAGAREGALAALLAGTSDGDRGVRIQALRTLGGYAGERSVAALVAALGAGDGYLATVAAQSLGQIGPPARASAAELATLARSPALPVMVRTAAAEALGSVAPFAAEEVAGELAVLDSWRLRAAAARAYALVGPASRAELSELIRDPDPRVAAAALGAATQGSRVSGLRSILVEAVGHPNVGVRAVALGALAGWDDPSFLPLLLDAYGRAQRDRTNDAALAAVDALAGLRGAAPARAFFTRFSRSPDFTVRRRVAELFPQAAGRWGDPAPAGTRLTAAGYRGIVRDLVAPALAGRLPKAVVETGSGRFEVELLAARAPLTVHNFISLAEAGYFDGQEWPRVVPNFVIQGGDPEGDTSGGPGYAIRDEINRARYLRGSVGMALAGPDTGGSQFFVTHSPQPHLDGGYTVFGRVIAGMEVVDRVTVGEVIRSVKVVRR
ncbi:MAG: peptidylprolyl isomerase [Longimicrobiaceae bacterium]